MSYRKPISAGDPQALNKTALKHNRLPAIGKYIILQGVCSIGMRPPQNRGITSKTALHELCRLKEMNRRDERRNEKVLENAMKERFEEVTILGKPALFTDIRIGMRITAHLRYSAQKYSTALATTRKTT